MWAGQAGLGGSRDVYVAERTCCSSIFRGRRPVGLAPPELRHATNSSPCAPLLPRPCSIRGCGLCALPPDLTALTSLLELAAARNTALGIGTWGVSLPFAPLGALRQLAALDLALCGLSTLPEELSALSRLQRLAVGQNGGLGKAWLTDGPAAAFGMLPALAPSLTYLDISASMLPGVPPQVTTLWRLRFLDASHNGLDYWPGDCRALPASQCAWGGAGLQSLLRLRSLADVDVGGCRLALADSSSVLSALEGRGVRVRR